MNKGFWCILALFAMLGFSHAAPLLMMVPGGGPMGGGPPGEEGGDGESSDASAFAAPGAGLPLVEVGLGVAILAAGYWWIEIRGRPKRGAQGSGECALDSGREGHDG